MMCPGCGHGELTVIDVRATDEGRATRRRRECARCKRRMTTYEREEVEPAPAAPRLTRSAVKRAQGKCQDCSAAPAPGATRCAGCGEIHRIKNRKGNGRPVKPEALKEGCAG